MTEQADRTCCEFLPWDSEFFGLRIGRLTVNRLDPELWSSVEAWCRENAADCIYFLTDPADDGSVRTAEENRFRMVDIRMTFERKVAGREPAAGNREQGKPGYDAVVRSGDPKDLDVLVAIARTSHRDSRFYHDGNFPASRCDDLFEAWIRKSFTGLADSVLVADVSGKPVGYITCARADAWTGQIGLFGISPDFRGAGIGGLLLDCAVAWARGKGLEKMTVVTQGRNIPAQRFYQGHAFITADMKIWYHRWFGRV